MSQKWLSLALAVPLFLAGCGGGTGSGQAAHQSAREEAKIGANLAKLSPEDRKLAERQKYCAVDADNRLGEMGEPIKVIVEDEPVFLCCGACKKEALAHPEKTLARVRHLRGEVADTAKK